MAPIERGAERLMTRQRCASTLPEETELAIQKRSSGADSEGDDATGGELEGQCNPIESATQVSDDRRIGIAQHKGISARGDVLHEKPHGRKTHRFSGRES